MAAAGVRRIPTLIYKTRAPPENSQFIMSSDKDSKADIPSTQAEEDKEEGNLRYAAYANRLRTIMQASHRYVAYTSDIGESFRPIAHPGLIKLGYGVSWAYLIGDVGYAAWKARMKNEGRFYPGLKPWEYPYPPPNKAISDAYKSDPNEETDWKAVALKRGIFQSIASMVLPAFTIHSAVRYSSILFKNSKFRAIKTYGPVAVGLGIVPLLPYLFDRPIEEVVEVGYRNVEQLLEHDCKPAPKSG